MAKRKERKAKKDKSLQHWGFEDLWYNLETVYSEDTHYAEVTKAMLIEGAGVLISNTKQLVDDDDIDIMSDVSEFLPNTSVVTYVRNTDEVVGRRVVSVNVFPNKVNPGMNFVVDLDVVEKQRAAQQEELKKKMAAEISEESNLSVVKGGDGPMTDEQESPVETADIIDDDIVGI